MNLRILFHFKQKKSTKISVFALHNNLKTNKLWVNIQQKMDYFALRVKKTGQTHEILFSVIL